MRKVTKHMEGVMAKQVRHFLSIKDINEKEFWTILKLAKKLKKKPIQTKLLAGKTLAMIFEKSSTRTRVSFEVGMTQLGGHAEFLSPNDIQMGRGELISDTAKVLSRYVDIIMYRAYKHENIAELAANSSVPVINALSDLEHPCQILADLMTVWESFAPLRPATRGFGRGLRGLKMAYVGDCENNVTHSLALGCALVGMEFVAAGPKGYHMDSAIAGKKAKQVVDPEDAVSGADVVVTDTWVSMGDEASKRKRLKDLKAYQVNERLMGMAKKKAIFMHCLPALRGQEVTASVMDGKHSIIFDQAENRLHIQKAILLDFLGR